MTKEEQLIIAAANDDFKTVQEFLKNSSLNVNVVDDYGRTALHYSVKYYAHQDNMENKERMKIMELIVKRGADVTKQDYEGNTAFSYAIKYDHLDVVKFLFNFKACIGPKDHIGFTPFDYALAFTSENSEIGVFLRKKATEVENELNEYQEQGSISVPRCSR
ncbi:MAG: ankyrin repeat domain-containing protein [Pseudomonadota bacterium]